MTDRRQSLEQGARRINRAAYNAMQEANKVWYAGQVLSGKEFIAQKQLKQIGALPYLPLCRKYRRINRFKREKSKIAYPAVAGCIFIGFDAGQENWFTLFNQVSTLYGVMGVNRRPVAITGERLKSYIDDNKLKFDVAAEEQYMRTHHEFKVGDFVQIAIGPFEGHIVDVKQINGRNAKILIPLLGNLQDVVMPLDGLEKVA